MQTTNEPPATHPDGAGLSMPLEVVNRYETNVVNTAADMLTLIGETGADIGVQLDSYHMNIEENGFVEPIKLAANSSSKSMVPVPR